jgi:hypothetical protein
MRRLILLLADAVFCLVLAFFAVHSWVEAWYWFHRPESVYAADAPKPTITAEMQKSYQLAIVELQDAQAQLTLIQAQIRVDAAKKKLDSIVTPMLAICPLELDGEGKPVCKKVEEKKK